MTTYDAVSDDGVGIMTTHYSEHTNNILDAKQSMRHSNDSSHAIDNYISVTWYVTVQSSTTQ